MSGHSPEQIKRSLPLYMAVGGALVVLTAVTVGVAQIHFSSFAVTVAVAMLIAGVKGGLVASIFMHLREEKPILFATLILTVIGFALLMIIPAATVREGAVVNLAPPVNLHPEAAHGAEGHGGPDHAEDAFFDGGAEAKAEEAAAPAAAEAEAH